MNQKYIRSLLYGLIFLVVSHDLTIAQETKTEKVPEDPKAQEALFFYWKSELKDLMAQKKILDQKYADLLVKYQTDTDALKAENERLKKVNSELDGEKTDKVAARDGSTSNSDLKIAGLENEIAATRNQKEQFERELQAKTFAEKQAQDRIRTLENTITTLKSEKETLESKVTSNSLSATSSNSSATESNNSELQAQVKSLTIQRDQLQKDLSAQNSYIETLKKAQPASTSSTTTVTTTTETETKIKTLETKLNTVTIERDKLQKELAVAKAIAPTTSTETTKPDDNKKIADLQAQVNSLTNQRDQLQRDIAAIYGYQKEVNINNSSDPYSTIENNAAGKTTSKLAPASTTTSTSTKTVISTNTSLEEAVARSKKLEADLAEMTKQRDKLQKELDTNYNNMYNSKTNPLSGGNTSGTNSSTSTSTTTTVTTKTDLEASKSSSKSTDANKTGTDSTASKTQVDTKNPSSTATGTSTTGNKTETTTTTKVTSIEEAKSRIRQLEEELGILTKERDQLKRDLNASKADKTYEAKIAEVNKRIEKIQADKSLTAAERERKLKEANEEIERINEEKSDVELNIENNTKAIDKNSASIEDIKKEYESKIEALNKEISELKEDKEALETDLASSKEMLEEENSKHKEEIERLTLEAQKLEEALEKEIRKDGNDDSDSSEGTQVTSKGGKTIISLASHVNFRSGSKELTEQGKRTLNKVMNVLKKHSSDRIQVEGNTDNQPVSNGSKFKDNWHLSFERALTVMNYLNKGKLGKTQFVAAGLGDKNPIKPNNSAANRAANRRVDIVVMPRR